jgi:hypothetical protein
VLLSATKRPVADPNAALFAHARSVVADNLKDPESARFRSLSVVTDAEGNRKVCGEVNAKNAYGGYTGYTAFAYFTELGDTILAPEPDDDNANEINRRGSGCPGFGNWHS